MELAGKVAVITGAGSGIGRSLAQAFADEGARAVVCTDLNGENARETAAMVGERVPDTTVTSAQLDVSDERAIEQVVVDTRSRFDALDVFVSNAGYGIRGGLDLPTDEWERMMAVHTWSHLSAARVVIPMMLEQGGGYLLNTASAAGLLTQLDSGPYAVSKHAAVAFAEWVSINYGDQGIGVSVLCPQAVRTNILGPAAKSGAGAGAGVGEKAKAVGSANTRQAAGDGILEPEAVAADCVDAMREERFLVLPHPEVATYFERKATDYDRWLKGMRRFRNKLAGR